MKVLDVGRVEHEVSPEDSQRRVGRDSGEGDQGEIGSPDSVVLGHGEGSEGSVEGSAGEENVEEERNQIYFVEREREKNVEERENVDSNIW